MDKTTQPTAPAAPATADKPKRQRKKAEPKKPAATDSAHTTGGAPAAPATGRIIVCVTECTVTGYGHCKKGETLPWTKKDLPQHFREQE